MMKEEPEAHPETPLGPKGSALERTLATLLAVVLAAFVLLQILWMTRVL